MVVLIPTPMSVMASALASSVWGRCKFISSPSKSALKGLQQHSLNRNVLCGFTLAWDNIIVIVNKTAKMTLHCAPEYQTSDPLGRAIFYPRVAIWIYLHTQWSFESVGLSVQNLKTDFQDDRLGSHPGFPIIMILAILNYKSPDTSYQVLSQLAFQFRRGGSK